MTVDRIVMRRPDDFHVHFRLAELMLLVVWWTARVFARALAMPNTMPDIKTGEDALRYCAEILGVAPAGFTPLMTIRILPTTTPEIIRAARAAGVIAGKLYVGITTGSDEGISDLRTFAPVFAEMEKVGMPVSLHAEVPNAFCLDREEAFIPELRWLAATFPKLKIVVEHVTTEAMIKAILDLPENVAGSITAHHLWLTLDDVVGGKLQPHNFCKPLANRPEDRAALRWAAMSGNPKFFFGSDSAPHTQNTKECPEGCAGCFTAPVALELLAEIFEAQAEPPEQLDLDGRPVWVVRLEAFVSEFGARFYGLPLNEGTITLVRESWAVQMLVGPIVSWMAGRVMIWKVATPS